MHSCMEGGGGGRERGGERGVSCKLYQVNYSASLDTMWAQVEIVS